MNKWPKQADCPTFYGNPSKPDFESNLVVVPFPWMAVLAWDKGRRVKGARVHKKCSESLGNIFAAIWEAAGRDQNKINEWGLNYFGGGYAYRKIRGGTALSMHSFGCAVDFDPARNELGNNKPHFAECPEVLKAFADEGWVLGGTWSRADGMHFQATIP